jgi:hypothetical protein
VSSERAVSKNYLMALDDLMQVYSVQGLLKSSYARMRRPTYSETFLIGLPAYFFDFYRIAQYYKYYLGAYVTELPSTVYTSSSLASIPINNYTAPFFDTVKNTYVNFPMSPLITVGGNVFNNQISFEYSPPIIEENSSSNSYTAFNELMHKAIVQPGMLMMPFLYNKNLDNLSFEKNRRVFGPVLVTSASISGNEGGTIGFNISLEGSTCLAGVYTPSSSYLSQLITPGRTAGMVDSVVLVGQDAEPYFNANNLFRKTAFESDYASDIQEFNQYDVNRPEKRVVAFSLKIDNSYGFTKNMPAYTSALSSIDIREVFSSDDTAGQRYALLKERKVSGSITFLSENIDGTESIENFEDDYLGDNDETHRLIISFAPGYHFPLTNVQFTKGKPDYSAEKAVRVTHNFVARIANNAYLSLFGPTSGVQGPTSEFGFSYNLNYNTLFSG